MKKSTFKVPIYNCRVDVILTDDLSTLNKPYKINVNKFDYDAFVFKKENHHYLVAFGFNQFKPHIIAHEVVHLVNHIFNDNGIELDSANDEPQAYLTGFLFRKVFNILNKLENK